MLLDGTCYFERFPFLSALLFGAGGLGSCVLTIPIPGARNGKFVLHLHLREVFICLTLLSNSFSKQFRVRRGKGEKTHCTEMVIMLGTSRVSFVKFNI